MMPSSLFDDVPPPRETKAVNVPRTSVEAGLLVNKDRRSAEVVEWLRRSVLTYTSAELAEAMFPGGGLRSVLHVRRGLSDALAAGFVEHGPARTCSTGGSRCLTWRVVSR